MNDRAQQQQQQQQQQSRLSEKSLPGRLAAVIRRCLDAHLSVGAAPIFPTAALTTTTTTRATLLLDTGPHVELTAALATAAAAAAALPSRFATFFDDGTINTPSGAVARRTTCAVLPAPRAVRTPTEKAESLDVVAQWDDVTRRASVVLASVRCALPVVMSLPSWLHCGNDQS